MFQSRGPTCRKRPRSGAKSDSSSVLTTKARNVQDDGRSEDKRGKVGSPLKGAVVCLTGLSPCEKDHYHNLIEKLGGRYVNHKVLQKMSVSLRLLVYHSHVFRTRHYRFVISCSYTRDLNANNNTHLVCRQAEGAKYDLASSFPKQISIVTPTWLDECHAKLVRADERQHSLTPPNESAPQKHVDIKDGVPCNKMGDDGSLLSHVERLLAKSKRTKSILFSACHFHLVGFDDDQRFGKSGKQNKNFTQDECGERFVLLLGRLIRRGLGTIHYDFHDGITHVLVNDHAGEHLRYVATESLEFCNIWRIQSMALHALLVLIGCCFYSSSGMLLQQSIDTFRMDPSLFLRVGSCILGNRPVCWIRLTLFPSTVRNLP